VSDIADARLAAKTRQSLGREHRAKAAEHVLVDVAGLKAVSSGEPIDLRRHVDGVVKDDDVAGGTCIPDPN
jgi:hypothetical protein